MNYVNTQISITDAQAHEFVLSEYIYGLFTCIYI